MNNIIRFKFTNLDQIIFYHKKITKKMLLDYYQYVSPYIIEHTSYKPILLHRFINGIDHQGTFDATLASMPDWITLKKISLKVSPHAEYMIINTVEQLLYVINHDCITPHIFLHNTHNLYYPDFMVFILKKKDHMKFNLLTWATERVKNILESYHIKPFGMLGPKNTIIILVPLQAKDSFKQVRMCAFNISKKIAQEYPHYLTIDSTETAQESRIFIDTECNRINATIPCPYSVLPEHQAPVAIPFFWGELHRLKQNKETIATIEKRLNDVGDPWKELKKNKFSLFNFTW